MPWELRIDSFVLKQLKRIPRNYAERILEVIRSFAINPYAGDIEKMKGEDSVGLSRADALARIAFSTKLIP